MNTKTIKGSCVIDTIIKAIGEQQGVPSEFASWAPDLSGDIDIVIDQNGAWWHEGGLIQRAKLVTLFQSILRFEKDVYYLVTPVEKWRIAVEDVPFIVSDIEYVDGALMVYVETGGSILIDDPKYVQTRAYLNGNAIYVHIRDGLWGRLNRAAYYRLMDEVDGHDNTFGLQLSRGWIAFD